jgi:hypothetical protein
MSLAAGLDTYRKAVARYRWIDRLLGALEKWLGRAPSRVQHLVGSLAAIPSVRDVLLGLYFGSTPGEPLEAWGGVQSRGYSVEMVSGAKGRGHSRREV